MTARRKAYTPAKNRSADPNIQDAVTWAVINEAERDATLALLACGADKPRISRADVVRIATMASILTMRSHGDSWAKDKASWLLSDFSAAFEQSGALVVVNHPLPRTKRTRQRP